MPDLSLADIAAQYAPRGGGGDFWRPEDGGGAVRVRLYRVVKDGKASLIGGQYKSHFWGGKYTDCSGPGCETCRTVEMLKASGSKEDRTKAGKAQANLRALLVIVLPDDPIGFRLWEASTSIIQRILIILATKGNNGLPVRFPKKEQDFPRFGELAELGAMAMCGPLGEDIAVSYDSKAPPQSKYDISKLDAPPGGFKELPFKEEDAPDPMETLRRIREARAKKA